MRATLAICLVASLSLGCAEQARDTTALDGGFSCTARCASGARRCGQAGTVQICADYTGDGCPEWGGDVTCPSGAACDDGACVATCEHLCGLGESVCTVDGPARCGDADGDGCRALLPPTPCAADERCDDGACVPASQACVDACPMDEARACVGDGGYRRCGQADADPCLEWSTSVACEPGTRCRDGECVPDCVDDCAVGETRCDGEGFLGCGNFDGDVCLEFGNRVTCAADERCDGGACVPADQPCEDLCDPPDTNQCTPDARGFQRCGQFDADPCVELSGAAPCGPLQACEAGACVDLCESECAGGANRCVDGGVSACGNVDGDPCLEWSPPVPCAPGERCDNGRCVEEQVVCEDVCAADARRCAEGGVEICANVDEDPCLEWASPAPCAAGERCEGSVCVADCVDDCVDGELRCSGAGLTTCGDFDGDPCLELGPATPCAVGESCSDGACRVDCVDDCAADSAECTPAGDGFRRCGQFDADACLDWSSPTPCGPREACEAGACQAICQDECAADDRRCLADSFEICGDFDADPCLEFGGGAACEAGQRCEAGSCLADCRDECAADTTQCAGAGAVQICGNFDGDPCLELGQAERCGAAERCQAGACGPLPPPAVILINEVRFDPTGPDAQGAFIELWGPAGTPLTGFRLVAINGNGGGEYAIIPLSGALPADGLFVIAHPNAPDGLRGIADLLSPSADLQNAPDSLQLQWGARVVDALAYGVFGAGTVAAGEGTPAPDTRGDDSLSRDPDHTDTQDNAADFHAGPASPGALVPCVDACPAVDRARCTGTQVERCDLGVDGCLGWVALEDCAAVAGGTCADGACAVQPVCALPEIAIPLGALAGLSAGDTSLAALPDGPDFAVVAGAPGVGMTFGRASVDGQLIAGPHTLGNTDFGGWGGRDSYFPSMVAGLDALAITWSGFSDQGNRDIYLRRVLPGTGEPVPRPDPVISGGDKGFAPILRRTAAGYRVWYNAYTLLTRIDLNAQAAPAPTVRVGVAHGDTRERGTVTWAPAPDGGAWLAYTANLVDFGQPHLFLQRLDAAGAASGDRIDEGPAEVSDSTPGVWLFALPDDHYALFWRTTLVDPRHTAATWYGVFDGAGVLQTRIELNTLDRPPAYTPDVLAEDVAFDGRRFGVVHLRSFDPDEPLHYMVQWLTPEGVHLGRTELGDHGGILVQHPADGQWYVFHGAAAVDMRRLGCP